MTNRLGSDTLIISKMIGLLMNYLYLQLHSVKVTLFWGPKGVTVNDIASILEVFYSSFCTTKGNRCKFCKCTSSFLAFSRFRRCTSSNMQNPSSPVAFQCTFSLLTSMPRWSKVRFSGGLLKSFKYQEDITHWSENGRPVLAGSQMEEWQKYSWKAIYCTATLIPRNKHCIVTNWYSILL